MQNTEAKNPSSNPSHGVRALTIQDQAPDAEIFINRSCYSLSEIVAGKKVVDIGCGYGRFQSVVETAGGSWVGVEPFEGGAHMVVGSAEDLPFEDKTFDVAIMHAVLEHVQDVNASFSEASRVLKPGGKLVGYVAFMECFHEISYSHLSYKALEYYAEKHNMKLKKVSGGGEFGISYHLGVLLYPVPTKLLRRLIDKVIRGTFRLKSRIAYVGLRWRRKWDVARAKEYARLYYQVECLRQSVGFDFVIEKR
jgi:SAM-dependent methyltransferase